MQKEVPQKQQKGRENQQNMSEFTEELIHCSSLTPVTNVGGQGFLRDKGNVRFIKDKESECMTKMIVLSQNYFKVFELNPSKTGFKHLHDGCINDPERLLDWEVNPKIHSNSFNGELVIAGTFKRRIEAKPISDPAPQMMFFKTNIKNAHFYDQVKIKKIATVKNFSPPYYIESFESFFPRYLKNSFINSSVFFFSKYSYGGVKFPGRNSSSYMVDSVRNKPDSKGSCVKSVFELFGWEFKNQFLEKKLQEDKLLLEDQRLRDRVKFSSLDKNELSMLSRSRDRIGSYYCSVLKKEHFIVISLIDMRSKKVLKTTFISIYEIWKTIDLKFVKSNNAIENFGVRYSFPQGKLYLGCLLEEVDYWDQEEDEGDDWGGSDGFDVLDEDFEDQWGYLPPSEEEIGMNFGEFETLSENENYDNRQDNVSRDNSLVQFGATLENNNRDNDELPEPDQPKSKGKDSELLVDKILQKLDLNPLKNQNHSPKSESDLLDENEEAEPKREEKGDNQETRREGGENRDQENDRSSEDLESSEHLFNSKLNGRNIILITISNTFDSKIRKIKSEPMSQNQTLMRYQGSTLLKAQESKSDLRFKFINEEDGSENLIRIDKKSNQLTSRLTQFRTLSKVDESKLIFCDSKTIYLIDLEQKRVLDRITYRHILNLNNINQVYACDDLLIAYQSFRLIAEFFQIRGKEIKFLKELDLVPILDLPDEKVVSIRKIQSLKKLDSCTLLICLQAKVRVRGEQFETQELMIAFELDLVDWRVIKRVKTKTDASNAERWIRQRIIHDSSATYLVIELEQEIKLTQLDENYQWRNCNTMKFKSDSEIGNYFFRDYKLFVTYRDKMNYLDCFKFDPEKNLNNEPTLVSRIEFEFEIEIFNMIYDYSQFNYIWVIERNENISDLIVGVREGEVEQGPPKWCLRAYDLGLNEVCSIDFDKQLLDIENRYQLWTKAGDCPVLEMKNFIAVVDFETKKWKKIEMDVKDQLRVFARIPNGDLLFYEFKKPNNYLPTFPKRDSLFYRLSLE